MAIYDETVKKYKQYLKDAQIEALMEQSRQYNRENAGNRADAVSQARSDYDTAYRGLQNMGLAGAKGTEITGEVPRLKTNIAGQFNRVNAQLYNREQQAVEALGGQYAAQTKAQQAAEAEARAAAVENSEAEEAAKRNAVGGLVTGAVSAALAGQTKPNANTATLIPSKGQRTGMETAAKARGTGGMVTGATAAAIAQQEFEQKKALAAMQALGIRRSKFASSPTQKTAAKTTVNALQSSQAVQQEYLSAMEMLRRAQAGAQKDPRAGSGVAYYADKVGEILSNATIPTEQRVQMAMEYLQADVDERTSPLADRKAKEIIARAYGLKVPKSDETFDALDKARRSKPGKMGYGVGATYDKDAEIAFRQEQSNRAEYNYYMPAIANKIRYAGKTGKVNDKETDFVYNVINGKITEETLKKLYGRSDPGTKYRYLLLDEEEKNAYNYLYEKKGLKAANNYADSLMPLLEMRGAEADKAAWEEYTKEHPVAANIHSVGLSAAEIAPAISRIGIGAYNEISGTKNPAYVDTNSTLYSGTNRRTTIRTKTSGMILGDNPTGWQKVKNFAYNTGMSMADSATMLPFAYAGLPWVSDLVFFSSASNDAYKDAISRGANQADAILAGAASGIAEALFEHVSLDKVVKMSTSGKGKFIMNILKQAGIEASEEACTSVANLITDKLFLGELSNNELDRRNYIQEYMATGMSREEAEKKADIQVFTDTIKDIGMDALGGFASGLGFGLFGAATNAYTQKQIGKEVKQNSEVLDNDYRVAELLGGETADLARKYDQRSITEMEAGDLHTAIVSKLQEQAEVSEKNAETVAAVLDGREISADQAADMLQSSKDFLQEAGYDTSSTEALAASYNQRVEEVATAQKEAFDNRARDYNIKRAEEVYTDKEALRNVPRTLPTGVSPVQFAEAERSNFKSRTTIQADGVELQLSLMDMDGRFTNEQKLERARKAMTAQAQRKLDMIGKISKALGMDVVVHDYMRGSNGYFGEDGKIHFVLSGHMSVARVAAHELTHQMQSVASEKYTVVRDQLIEDVGQDRFDRLLKRKAAQYGYNMESEQGRLACDEEVIAELCEGMLSDKDRLERFAERHTDTALTLKDRLTKILNAIHATLKDTFGQNQNRISDMITDEKTADKWLDGLDEVLKKVQEKQQAKEFGDAGTKFSILEIVDGKKIAWVENSGLSRRDLHDYKKVAEYIGEHIGEAYTIIESGSRVYIGEDLPGEYTQSEYTRRLFAKNRSALFAKNKATDSIGDMIEIAENRRWEKTKHTHNKDAKYGMYRYDTCFAFPIKNNAGKVVDVKAYDAELLIRNASNGKKYLYDIVNIKENTDYQLELQQRKSRKGGAMLPTDSGVSSGTMTQNGESVNSKFSLDTEQLEKTVRAIDTKALEEGLQSMTLTSNVNSFTMKDPSRFFDAISKNNTELRDELHDIFEKPHSEATGKYARGIKDMQERVRNIATEAGILSKDGKKFDKAASAAVQNYGEGYQLKKCTVEAKVVDADTVFINAVSDGINVLSGDFTLQEVRKNFGRENGDMIWEKAFDQAQKNSERGQKASAIEYESTTSPYKLTDLQTQFPRTWQKLVEADKAFREMYDEYIGNMNAMLREIYPNSFTKEDDTVAKIDDLVEKKKHRITDTEKAIAERMKSLGKVEAEMAAKKRTDTKAYDTLRRRQTALNEAIADLNEKKAGYNEDIAALAVKKNAIFELDKSGESLNRMHQLEYRQDYYHHFNEMSVGLKEAWNLILQGSNRDISPAVVGNTANSKAKTRWAGFFQQRKGGAYTADAVNGMLKYGALAEYKLAFDPLVAYLRDAEKKIRDVSDETNRNSLILYLNSWTNQIAGKSSDFDRLLTDRGVVGRNILNFLQKLNGRVIRNTLYFNARSAIVQISNISNAVSLVTNPKDWKNGVLCWSRAAKGDEMMQNIMSQSNFLASRFAGVEMMDTSTMAKAERFANWMLSIADTISAKATWWAAYNQYVRDPNSKSIMSMPRKYESAVDYADDVTRRTHGGRGVGEKAPIMTSKLVSFFAPFQLEVNNTYQLLKENIKKKNALGIATMEATVFAMNAVFEAIVGSTVLPFDFVRALIDILFGAKDIQDDDDDDHKLASTLKLIGQRIGAETVSGLPYAGMIPQFLGEDTTEAVFGETDMTKYGNVNMGVGGAVGIGKVLAAMVKWPLEGVKPDWFSAINELSEILPPIGGKQIARTIGGIATVAQGYSGKRNSKGKDTVQFATDRDILELIHAGIFGKWALTEASEYFGEDRILPKLFGYYNGESASAGSPVKAEEFQAARALGLSGKGYFTIRKELKGYRTQEGKRNSLYTTNLTPAQKAGMDALLVSTTGESSEAKSEGAIVYGRTKQEDGSWGEWKVKADYSSEDLFKLSLYGDTKYSAGTTALKNGAGIKNVLSLLDTVDAYNDANEKPMTATQKRDWLHENVKDTKQAALLDAYILSKNKSTNVKVEGNVVYTMSLGEDGKPSVAKDGTVAEWKVKADYTDDTWYAISQYGDSKYQKGLTAVRKGANPKTIRKYLDDMQAYQDSHKNQSMSSEERGQWIRKNGGTPKEQAILDAYMLRKDSNTDAKVKDGIVYTLELGEDGKPKVYKSGSVAEWKVKADYTSDEWYAASQTDYYNKAKTAYSACGIKPTVFVDFYTKWSDLSAKDASGKTVSGLKKKRTKELLDKMKISTEQKAYLYYKVCGYK